MLNNKSDDDSSVNQLHKKNADKLFDRLKGTENNKNENKNDFHNEANENLRRALRTSENTNAIGYNTLQSLGKQRETIQHSQNTIDETELNLNEAGLIISNIRWKVYKEYLIKGCVILVLVILIILLFYKKFIKS